MSDQKIPDYTKKYIYRVTFEVEIDEGTYFPEWTDVKALTIIHMEQCGMDPDEIANSVREIRTIRLLSTPADNIPGIDVKFMDIIPIETRTAIINHCSLCEDTITEEQTMWSLATPYCPRCWDAPLQEGD